MQHGTYSAHSPASRGTNPQSSALGSTEEVLPRDGREQILLALGRSRDLLSIMEAEQLVGTLKGGKFLHVLPPNHEGSQQELPNPVPPPEIVQEMREVSEHLADYEARMATASRPNVFCGSCRHPLGKRPPSGPKGEAPTVVYVRGARYAPRECHKLWWDLPDGQRLLSCTHAHLDFTWAVIASVLHSFTTGQRSECDCDAVELHALYKYFMENRAAGMRAIIDLPHAMGIVQLLRWKPTALVQLGPREVVKVRGDMLGSGRVRVRYRTDDDSPAEKYAWVPIDGIPVPRGTRGKCPRCGAVQRLE